MDKIYNSIQNAQMKDKQEAWIQAINDLEKHGLQHGAVFDFKFSEDEKDARYEEIKESIKVLKIYGESEDVPVLKPFLGKTTDYGNLQKLLAGKTPSEQSMALKNLIKSYDPSSEENKALLSQLFANLLQYINDIFSNLKEISESFLILESITPQFNKIAIICDDSSRHAFAELLTEKYNEYRKNPQQIPDMDTLIFFNLVSPTSDFPYYHGMTKPCYTFMSEILSTCRFQNARSISRGLFVAAMMADYTSLAKRHVPASINFLRGVLFLSTKTNILYPAKPVPPFDFRTDAKILILKDDCSKLEFGMRISPKDLFTDSIDNGFKIRSLLTAVLLLKEFFDNCDEFEQSFIFDAHRKFLKSLNLELYPEKVSSAIKNAIQYMSPAPLLPVAPED